MSEAEVAEGDLVDVGIYVALREALQGRICGSMAISFEGEGAHHLGTPR